MKRSARVSEKLANPGLPGLQVATRLQVHVACFRDYSRCWDMKFLLASRINNMII